MRADLVVVEPPRLDPRPRVLHRDEPVLVEAFVSQLPVEALRVGVIDRLPRPDEVHAHAAAVGPGIERGAGFRQRARGDDPLEDAGGAQAGDRRVDLGGEALAGEVVDDVENADPRRTG